MKIKPLTKDGKSIMLSGKIDKDYIVLPGVKITFAKGSTYEGVDISKGKVLWNFNQYVSQQFILHSSGQIQLIPVPIEAWGEEERSKSLSTSDNSYEPDDDSLTPEPIPNLADQPAPDVDQHTELELSGNVQELSYGGCCIIS